MWVRGWREETISLQSGARYADRGGAADRGHKTKKAENNMGSAVTRLGMLELQLTLFDVPFDAGRHGRVSHAVGDWLELTFCRDGAGPACPDLTPPLGGGRGDLAVT
jgi:hypothetical protein